MSISKKMTGTVWHVEKMVRGDGDQRRHRSRCSYYRKSDNFCSHILTNCFGSAHCSHYKEKDSLEHQPNAPCQKSSDAPQALSPQAEQTKKQLQIIGTHVSHATFGLGTVYCATEKYTTVSFDSGLEKKFSIDFCVKNQIFKVIAD